MCEPASGWLTCKGKVFWGTRSESHEEIKVEHKLHVDGPGEANAVPFEITPEGKDFRLPLSQWRYKLDLPSDLIPGWYDAAQAEARVREVLPEWVAAKIVLPGETREVRDGVIVACYGSATLFDSASATLFDSASAEAYRGTTVIAYTAAIPRSILKEAGAVLIDRSGDKVKCYVGPG
jgi:hypothetical protein